MAHRLLVAPMLRMEGKIKLPLLQDVGGAVTRRFDASLMPRDSLRRVNTSRSLISTSPHAQLQRFTLSKPGYPNSPESMSNGLMKRNAGRINKTNRATGLTVDVNVNG